MPDTQITIQYVNPRQDNRPPSLKSEDGAYYTISDAAYASMLPWKGNSGLISYFQNQRGYNIATHWNGAELPKDQKYGSAPTAPTPPVSAPPVAPPAPKPSEPAILGRSAPYGYVQPTSNGHLRTLPTVREQFIMKIVEAGVHSAQVVPSLEQLKEAITAAKWAWAQQMEATGSTPATGPEEPTQDDVPPWVTENVG